jgi:hypothetical protein
MSTDEKSLTTSRSNERLPLHLEPMMMLHLAVTGDVEQRRRWREQIETILQAQAIDRHYDPEARALLARDRVWRRIRATGKAATVMNLALGAAWMAWLIPVYAIGHGFGWAAALTYLLPVPLAWKVGRRLFEDATLRGMIERGRRPGKRLAVLLRSIFRAMVAGYGFGFTLVFLQGLISAFMTPLPTLGAELFWDAFDGSVAGTIAAGISASLAPLLARDAPSSTSALSKTEL